MQSFVVSKVGCDDQCIRDDLRYKITGEHAVTLTLDWAETNTKPRILSARLLDLSPQGAKLALSAPLPTHKTLLLTISVPETSIQICAEVCVCWNGPSQTTQHVIGCRLEPRIPEGLFDLLVAGERLDRRETLHQQRDRLQIIRRLDETEPPIWGTLRNYSPSGFCFYTTTQQTMTPGDRIQVVLEEPEASMLVASVCWKLQQGNQYLFGCRLLGQKAGERFQQATEIASSENGAVKPIDRVL